MCAVPFMPVDRHVHIRQTVIQTLFIIFFIISFTLFIIMIFTVIILRYYDLEI